jgi:hypothetical protein
MRRPVARELIAIAATNVTATWAAEGGTSERERNEERDPREVFTRDLDLPRGRDRRPVRERNRVYEIDGAESRIRTPPSAPFASCPRAISTTDAMTHAAPSSPRTRGFAAHVSTPLRRPRRWPHRTRPGPARVKSARPSRPQSRATPDVPRGPQKAARTESDSKVYRAYLRAEERVREQGGRVDRATPIATGKLHRGRMFTCITSRFARRADVKASMPLCLRTIRHGRLRRASCDA